MKSLTRIVSFALAGALCSGMALADTSSALLANNPGSSFSYHVDFDGSFWNGQKVGFSRQSTITVGANNAVHVASTGKLPSDAAQLDGTLGNDGAITAANAGNRVESYNIVAGLLKNAPAALAAGATWSATVPIQTGATGQVSYLPVSINVVSSDANGTILQGTGTQSVTTSFGGYSVPIDMNARFAIRITKAGFDRCDFAATELVHAGPQTQNMQWKWSMTRVASERAGS
jgi:hypothetical protein